MIELKKNRSFVLIIFVKNTAETYSKFKTIRSFISIHTNENITLEFEN